MPGSSNWREDSSTRRQFVKAGAAGSAVVLAGCSGGGGGDTDTPDDGTSGGSGNQTYDQRFRVFDPLTSGATPTQRHLNPWNPNQIGCWHPGAAMMDRPVVYSPTKNEAYGLMVDEWEMTDETTLEATFSDEWTWHDGTQFNARDYVMEQQIELEIARFSAGENERADPVMKSISASDDYHVQIDLHDPLDEIFAVQNTIGAYNGNLPRGIFTKRDDDRWSQWHERLRNRQGDEKQEVISNITSASYPMIEDLPPGHGPFQLEEVGDDIIIMSKYEDHPHSDNINFDEFALRLFSTNQPIQPYGAGRVDASHKGFPVQTSLQGRLPNGHELFREGRSSNKLFAFNCGDGVEGYDSAVEDPRVRKAICHVFDRQSVSALLEGVNRLFDWPPCRVPGKVMSENSHPAAQFVKDNFTKYGQNDTERAAELLEDAGYTRRDNGNWETPDGNRFNIDFMNGAQRKDITILKQNLQDFGIATEQLQVDSATFDERRNNGEYDIMPDGSSANGVTALWSLGLVPDWIQSITHFQMERDIPMPIGDPQGENGTKTINIEEHIRQWQATGEQQYHRELLWWWNQFLPEAEMMYQPDAGAYNGSNWEMDVRAGIKNGVDDALYIAPKMEDGQLSYRG